MYNDTIQIKQINTNHSNHYYLIQYLNSHQRSLQCLGQLDNDMNNHNRNRRSYQYMVHEEVGLYLHK